MARFWQCLKIQSPRLRAGWRRKGGGGTGTAVVAAATRGERRTGRASAGAASCRCSSARSLCYSPDSRAVPSRSGVLLLQAEAYPPGCPPPSSPKSANSPPPRAQLADPPAAGALSFGIPAARRLEPAAGIVPRRGSRLIRPRVDRLGGGMRGGGGGGAEIDLRL